MNKLDKEKVIEGLRFTMAMILFNPMTGENKQPSDLNEDDRTTYDACVGAIELLKEQPTLYGYKIEYLAYIAMLMEKEGLTAEDAVKKFDDISLIFRMIIEEVDEKIRETLNEIYDG